MARGVGVSLALVMSLAACSSGEPLVVDHESGPAGAPGIAAVNPAVTHANDGIGTDEASLPAAITDLHQPRSGLYTAGQPAAEAWQVAAGNGVTTVINLRPAAEMGARDEAAEVAATGMAYFEIPVAGPGDINMDNAMALGQLIDAAPGAVLVHCASGNRVGALLALGAMEARDLEPEQALAFGRSAGLGSLESRVREVIQSAPATGCGADASC